MKKIFKKIIVFILRWEARLVLKKYKPKIVAITGSVGKTTAKDAVFAVFDSAFYARKSEKSFNSEIGAPLTILGCANAWNNPWLWLKTIGRGLGIILLKNHYPKWLIVEVGADAPGDIENLAKWLKPDIAVFTQLAKVPVHIEFFKSPQALFDEKKKLAKYLKKGGVLIVNKDDKELASLRGAEGTPVLSFGYSDEADVVASNFQIIYENSQPSGISFKVDYLGASVPVTLRGVLGKHRVPAVLAALAAGVSQKLNLVSISQALMSNAEIQPGRMKILAGIKNTILIDDSYNASPLAAEKALETLGEIEIASGGRKISALGAMLELGKYSAEEHKKIGKLVAKKCEVLITVGTEANKYITEGALTGGLSEKNIFQFENSVEAGKFLQNFIQEKDIILIKGSQSIRMEKLTEEIMAFPDQKAELLVRQDPEWLKR